MNRMVALIAGCLLSAASIAAHAQPAGPQLKMDSGFYIGAGVGRSEAREFCSIGGACDAKDMSWNLFAGYQFNRYFAVEGGYVDFGEATTSGFVGGLPTTVTAKTTAVELLAVGLLPITDNFAAYAKLGFFRYDSDGEATGGIVATSNGKGTELTFGLGAQYGFGRNFAARVEWQRYLDVGSRILGLERADIGVVRLGARYRF